MASCDEARRGDEEEAAARPSSLFISGYAKLPEGITASEMFRVVGIGLEVERETGVIVAADCTLATGVGRRFFEQIVKGRRLVDDFPLLIDEVEERYHGNAQKALVTALRIARDKFRACRDKAK